MYVTGYTSGASDGGLNIGSSRISCKIRQGWSKTMDPTLGGGGGTTVTVYGVATDSLGNIKLSGFIVSSFDGQAVFTISF